MQYEWSAELEIGYPSIDDQHKQLVETLNNLLFACEHGSHKSELKKTVDFLVTYSVKHFTDEEAFQIEHEYPDYERHKLLHDDFMRVALELSERLLEEGATVSLTAKVRSTLGEWLVNHIKGEDLQIGFYLRDREKV